MRFDLNLAAVLDAIMLERNVTRAASTLGMSQPAVSNALRRARALIGDRLFLKVADGVQPTSRMQAIWPDIHRSLSIIRASILPATFDPALDSTTFKIAVTDSVAVDAVHQIAISMRRIAPLARPVFAIHTHANSLDGLERGTLDCAVGMFPSLPRDIHVQALRTDRYVCVMRADHPMALSPTLETFLTAKHVLVAPSGNDLGVVDGWLSLNGYSRSISSIVNHFADALRIAAETDLLTCAPKGFVEGFGRHLMTELGLTSAPLPFETDKLMYKLIWHERLHAHPAHAWFRSHVADICTGAPRP